MEKYKNLRITYTESEQYYCFEQNELSDAMIDSTIDKLKDGLITSLKIEDSDRLLALTVFSENSLYFLGIIDEYYDQYFYYNDKSDNTTLIDIDGNLYPSNRVCKHFKIVYDSVILFIKERKRVDYIEWIIE